MEITKWEDDDSVSKQSDFFSEFLLSVFIYKAVYALKKKKHLFQHLW